MNKDEEKILHGIYYHREIVGEEVVYKASEINWLIRNELNNGKNWMGKDGKLQSVDNEHDDYLATIGATSAAAERPLAYLHEAGYIKYTRNSGYFRIAVTSKGADVARELDTFIGRANLLYKNNKDGLLWFLATVLVSLITALLAKCAD